MSEPIATKPLIFASTQMELAELGLHEVAYARQALVNNKPAWSIHDAAGATVGAAPTREKAMAAILQNDLIPHHVH
jgi:hypothetical protein